MGRVWLSGVALTEKQATYISYLLDPSTASKDRAHAVAAIGVSRQTLHAWENDGEFRAYWMEELKRISAGPDRAQLVAESMFQKALSGDVRAAELYMRLCGLYDPKAPAAPPDERVDDPSTLSDAELLDALRKLQAD